MRRGRCFRYAYSLYEAIDAVQAAGWELVKGYNEHHRPVFAYDHVAFVMPPASTCFPGIGVRGGQFSWVASYALDGSIPHHELGHNLGLGHANALHCEKDGVVTTIHGDCRNREYGDDYDVMGNSFNQFNAYHKARLGWLKATNVHTLNESSGAFTFDIEPNEFPTEGLAGLRIARGDGTYYMLDYRQPSPPFDDFQSTDDVVQGAVVRIVPEWDTDGDPSARILEVRPPCCNLEALVGAAKPAEGTALRDGVTFSDGDLLSITQVSHSSTSVRVKVAYGADARAPGAPQNALVLPTDPWANAPVLTWDPSSDDGAIEEYVIERETSGGAFEEVGRTAAYQFTFTLDPSDAGKNLRVWALDAAGHASPHSNVACVLAVPCLSSSAAIEPQTQDSEWGGPPLDALRDALT